MTDALPKRVREFIRGHPDTSPAAVFGRFRDDLEEDDLDAIAAALDAGAPELAPSDTDETDAEYITDPGFDGSFDAVRDHYERARPVYEALATLGDEYPTQGFASNAGWYYTVPATRPRDIDAGWDEKARNKTFDRDWTRILSEDLGVDDRDREMFNISSWKDPDAVYRWRRRRYDPADGEEAWEDGEKPTPGYEALRGFGFWCDLDLADKAGRVELTDEQLATVERAQARVIDLVADLYGVETDAVYALDSGGGSYIYGPPEAALPIADHLDAEERGWFFDDMRERMRDGFATGELDGFDGVWPTVTDEIDGAAELLDPDWIQNVNRQTKAPGAIHHDHDLVVTPLRGRDPETGSVTSGVDYTPTLVSEIDDDALGELVAWADGLTRIDHRDAVASLVTNLYPELAGEEDVDGWRDIVDERVETLRQRHESREERREAVRERLAERHDDADDLRSPHGQFTDVEITTDHDELLAAVETIDVRDVVRRHACDKWDTSTRSHEITFDPCWRSSGSGQSCAIPDGENTFIDNGVDAGGGPVKAYALGERLLHHGETAATQDVGDVWGDALDAMRADGYNIPVWVPAADDDSHEYDETPYWAVKKAAVALNVVDPDEFVEREADHGDTYLGFPDAETYSAALDALEERGIQHGRDRSGAGEPAPRQLTAEALLESDATLSRREAWRAAATVTPDHLDEPLALDADGDEWTCPNCGEPTDDVVRAAAVADGTLTCCEDAFDDPAAYDRLYSDVRRTHGAPLPEYIPPTQAVEDMDRARGAVEALHGWHILDSLESDVTDDAPAGEDAVAVLDPTWEDSESGERIVLFQSGVFYCREHERVLWPLQVVALEQGLVDTETDRLGDAFFGAYAHARTTYDAPLPPIAWNDAEEAPEPVHLPVLPDAEDLLGEGVQTDASELDDARADVSDLYDRLANSRGAPNYLLTAYPSLGKSHSAVVHASEYPTLYAATRKEIRQETAERAGSHGVSWMHLPTLGESRPPEPVLSAAVGYVREHGRGALRDRDALLEAVEDTYQAVDQRWPAYEDAYGDGDASGSEPDYDPEDDEVTLDRAACECGDGDHGPEWHLALWTARQLGEKPRDLHVRGETIFGGAAPCTTDGDCPYTRAWERATDPDAPIDLLIGHPVHAYVSGARTQPKRADNSDSIYSEDRVVVFDEFPAGAFMRDVEEEWPQHARWLAACLDARVEDVTDLMDVREEFWDDPFVREWLNAEASPPVADAIAAKREQASDPDSPDPDWQALVGAEFDVHGDLAALVDRAVEAAADPDREAEELLDAAQTALQGGREGAEALASGAEDGYAHPDAYWLLLALLAPADHEPDAVPDDDWRRNVTTRLEYADHFSYGTDVGGVKSVIVGDHVRLLVDRDMSGATLLTPPQLQANTVIGLDATGRPELWEPAVGGEFETRDIHETAAERRAFARDVLNLRVVQTSPHVHTYSSNPAGKNFGDDIALVEEIADTFGGHQLAQDRITTTSDPAVVTTKKVEDYIGDDLLEAGADSIDHYGDLIGSNRLGDATVGVVLGAEHYGHDTAERWALLTGEEFDVSGHGTTLDYTSPTANAMLRRMWDDQVMQAIMRFGRDEEGAVVFAHTAALRDDLPVVDHGDVATAWTANQRAVAAAAADRAGSTFTVADVAADSRVDCHRRTVRRLLNEFADLGYMHREHGHTNQYELLEEPGTGEVEFPEVEAPAGPSASNVGPSESGQTSVENTNTWFVWSRDALTGEGTRTHTGTPTLGPPDGNIGSVPAGPPPG